MTKLEAIIFNVEQGFCAYIRSPTKYNLLLDCGKAEKFSPIRYIVSNELENSISFNGYSLAKFILSHPHDDHIEDIHRLKTILKPAVIYRQRSYDWEELKEPGEEEEYENLNEYVEWQATYNQPATDPNWGEMKLQYKIYLNPEEAKDLNEKNYVNNSSIPISIEYKGYKILFGGDLEKEGWEELLKGQEFRNMVEGTKIYVCSHHGHKAGFSSKLYEIMGKPDINIVSAHKRDESVDSRYSSEEFAEGVKFKEGTRYMLSTRKDGSIILRVNEKGRCTISRVDLGENIKLSELYY